MNAKASFQRGATWRPAAGAKSTTSLACEFKLISRSRLPRHALRRKIAAPVTYYHYILFLLLIAFTIAVGGNGAGAVSESGHFKQHLLGLQRSGSCAELPVFGVSTHQRRNPDDVNVRLVSEIHAQMVRFDIPW